MCLQKSVIPLLLDFPKLKIKIYLANMLAKEMQKKKLGSMLEETMNLILLVMNYLIEYSEMNQE